MKFFNLLILLCTSITILPVNAREFNEVKHLGSLMKAVHGKYKNGGVIIGSSADLIRKSKATEGK